MAILVILGVTVWVSFWLLFFLQDVQLERFGIKSKYRIVKDRRGFWVERNLGGIWSVDWGMHEAGLDSMLPFKSEEECRSRIAYRLDGEFERKVINDR